MVSTAAEEGEDPRWRRNNMVLCFINQYADAWYYNHVTYEIKAWIHKRQYQAATTLRRQQQQDEVVDPAEARRCHRDICEGKRPFREIPEKKYVLGTPPPGLSGVSAGALLGVSVLYLPRVVLLFHMSIVGLPNSVVLPIVAAAPLFAGALAAVLDISSLGSSCLVDIHMYGDAGCPSILQRTISSSSNVRTSGGRQGSLSASCLNLRASDLSHDLLHVRHVRQGDNRILLNCGGAIERFMNEMSCVGFFRLCLNQQEPPKQQESNGWGNWQIRLCGRQLDGGNSARFAVRRPDYARDLACVVYVVGNYGGVWLDYQLF
ncbi:uncharacterized protein [Aegilops tauschii subsp. strangulata]|uniref:uncharacterized protein n=1 Tax=Aegilops tauschii subsp. strangulata TaxID=200361 RepID=UPI001ABCE501